MAAAKQQVVDMELKKAFQELQTKMISAAQQMKISDAQVETLKRSIQHSLLVEKEISLLPKETRVYQGVGRMFMLSPIPDVKVALEQKIKHAETTIKNIESNKAYVERSMKESEDNLRELVMSKQGGQS